MGLTNVLPRNEEAHIATQNFMHRSFAGYWHMPHEVIAPAQCLMPWQRV